MRIDKIIEILNAKIVVDTTAEYKQEDFQHGFSSDLMSDVLRLSNDSTVLITGLCNIQTIRTAEMAEIKVIVLARGKKADENMMELASENDICILETEYSLYKASGELYVNGLNSIY